MLLYTVLVLVGVFFALTRTRVGRDELRQQIVREFNDRFQGRLEIGSLSGNLVNDLYAGRVHLTDASGKTIARIDSLVLKPRWRDLFSRRLSIRSASLYKPVLLLERSPQGRWNLSEALKEKHPGPRTAKAPWTFASADVSLVDGLLTIRNRGDLPAAIRNGNVFDYTNTQIQRITARATVEWKPDIKMIDFLSLRGRWAGNGIPIHDVRGQVVINPGRLSLNQFDLLLGSSHISLTALVRGRGGLDREGLAHRTFSLHLDDSYFDFDELKQFVPALPLFDRVKADIEAEGTFQSLDVKNLELQRGQTFVRGNGRIQGLPDSLHFDLTFDENRLAWADVAAVMPGADHPKAQRFGLAEFSLDTEGGIELSGPIREAPFHLEGEIDLRSPSGNLNGTFAGSRRRDTGLALKTDVGFEAVDLAAVLDGPAAHTRLNGHLKAGWQNLRPEAATGDFDLTLGPSEWSGRTVDSLRVGGNARNGYFETGLYVRKSRSILDADARLDLTGVPLFDVRAHVRRLNLGPWLRKDSLETNLNSWLIARGSGHGWNDLQGRFTLSVEASEIRAGRRRHIIEPHYTTIAVTLPESDEPRVTISGDVLEGQLDGDLAIQPLTALGKLWGRTLENATRRVINKPYPSVERLIRDDLPDTVWVSPVIDDEQLQQEARLLVGRISPDSVITVDAELAVKRSDLVSSLFPEMEPVQTDLRTHFHVTMDRGDLRIESKLSADSLVSGGVRLEKPEITLLGSGRLEAAIEQSLVFDLTASAHSASISKTMLFHPTVSLVYRDRAARMVFEGQQSVDNEAYHLSASLDLLPEYNRLVLQEFTFNRGDYTWSSSGENPFFLYRDAVYIPGLTLNGRSKSFGSMQQIQLHGTYSNHLQDTVYVNASGIVLSELSSLFHLKYRFGGLLDGRLALTGGRGAPVLESTVHVSSASMDHHVLGDVNLTNRYRLGSSDVDIHLDITPYSGDSIPTGLVKGRRMQVEENRLQMAGTAHLPERGSGRSVFLDSDLDLQLDIERADLFFFDYLFSSVLRDTDGWVSGTSSIRGTLRKPIFNAGVELSDISLRIPRFGLQYTGTAGGTVDTEGIHIARAVLNDATGGSATIHGSLLFNNYEYFSLNVDGRLDQLQVINVPNSRDLAFYGKIWATGEASLDGPIYNALLQSADVVTTPESEIFIPIVETAAITDPGFIVFADSTGKIPDLNRFVRRKNVLSQRAAGERSFTDGLDMDFNIYAPPGSTVHLVIDPLLGDEMNAVGSGRIQFQRKGGEYRTYGTLDVVSGDYLFTAGDVFFRRFLIDSGTITWDGDPTEALMDVQASYRTRASQDGLEGVNTSSSTLIPLIVKLNVTGRVSTPTVDLSLAIDRENRAASANVGYESLEYRLNQPELSTEYATSVLLTNSFLLTASKLASDQGINGARAGNQLAFNSVSQLVTSQINRYISQAVPNLDLNLGFQGERAEDLDVTYGVALRLLDERLIIRGQGVYERGTDLNGNTFDPASRNRGEFVVEVKLNPAVSLEVFYRRESDLLTEAPTSLTSTTGAGLSYQTQFVTWRRLFERIFGIKSDEIPPPPPQEDAISGE